jgi:hypothetical protein
MMDFYTVLDQVIDLLKQRGRVSYQALKLQFHLDDASLAALKEEILFTQPQAVDESGRGLVWRGDTEGGLVSASQPAQAFEPPQTQQARSIQAESPSDPPPRRGTPPTHGDVL